MFEGTGVWSQFLLISVKAGVETFLSKYEVQS